MQILIACPLSPAANDGDDLNKAFGTRPYSSEKSFKDRIDLACTLPSFLTMKRISFIVALLAFSGNAPVAGASSAGSAALKAFREIDYRYFVAGGTCAAISHGITTPIDVVKTRMQASPKVSFSGKSLFCPEFRYGGGSA